MLTSKQRAFLRANANNLISMIQIGKDGLNENTIQSIEDYFVRHELLKLNILKSCTSEIKELAEEISSTVNADVVSIVGRKIIIYRFNKDLFDKNESFILPR